MNNWDANQYTKFENERTQPSIDLIRHINIAPESIIDIGCGPGNSTNQLKTFFPNARILGIDNSDNMLNKAKNSYKDLSFKKCNIPDDLVELENCDLIFSNACLHWIPNHADLLPRLTDKLNNGGMLAVQMPYVQNALFYKLLDALISTDKWQKLSGHAIFHNLLPNEYYDILSKLSKNVTMWETTYYHVVPSHDAVIDWYSGSGLRVYLDMLSQSEKEEFLTDLKKAVKNNFPIQKDNSVILKMPRFFFTVTKE